MQSLRLAGNRSKLMEMGAIDLDPALALIA